MKGKTDGERKEQEKKDRGMKMGKEGERTSEGEDQRNANTVK